MMDKVLQDIGEAEARAADIEEHAMAEARNLLQTAKATAQRILHEGVLQEERRVSSELSAFDLAAQDEMRKTLGTSAQAADKVLIQANARMDAAVALIVEGVLGKYGNC